MSVKAINPGIPVKNTSEVDLSVAASVPAGKEVKTRNQQQVKVTKEDAQNIADVMNKMSQLFNHQLNFEVFEATDQLYVQIVDRKTQEVIKQIPPKEMLELSAKIQEMVGLILDKYV